MADRPFGSPAHKALRVQCTELLISGTELESSLILLTMTERLVSAIFFNNGKTLMSNKCKV